MLLVSPPPAKVSTLYVNAMILNSHHTQKEKRTKKLRTLEKATITEWFSFQSEKGVQLIV